MQCAGFISFFRCCHGLICAKSANVCIYIAMNETETQFFDSAEAAEMAEAYRLQRHTSLLQVEELLHEADETERRIKGIHMLLLRRKRVRLELKLQRILLTVLGVLSPDSQELGSQVYERILSCVDRLEKLC